MSPYTFAHSYVFAFPFVLQRCSTLFYIRYQTKSACQQKREQRGTTSSPIRAISTSQRHRPDCEADRPPGLEADRRPRDEASTQRTNTPPLRTLNRLARRRGRRGF